MVLFTEKNNPHVDISKISPKSSTKVFAECSKCGRVWSTSKRNVARGFGCKRCKAFKNSVWVSAPVGREIAKHIVDSTLTDMQPDSEKSVRFVDVKCPDCNTVMRRRIKTLYKDFVELGSFCRVCYPGTSTGALFLANNTKPEKMILSEIPAEDILMHTREKYFFMKECGHISLERPIRFLEMNECHGCLDKAGLISHMSNTCRLGTKRIPTKNVSKDDSQIEYIYNKVEDNRYEAICLCGNTISHTRETAIKKINTSAEGNIDCKSCSLLKHQVNPLLSTVESTWTEAIWSKSNTKSTNRLTTGSAYRAKLECPKGHTWESFVYAITGECPYCFSRSSGEMELASFLKQHDITFRQNDRTLITPYEVDFYIPGAQIAIEYNGLYWHSDAVKIGKNYHYDKWKDCADQGVQLITVWEDDWINRRSVVEKMLLAKLGKLKSEKTPARKTTIVEVQSSDVRDFLNAHHIQGAGRSSKYYALRDTAGDTKAVLAVSYRHGETVIDRYASKGIVQGGFTKMLKHVTRQLSAGSIVSTFSDNTVSDGGLYKNSGFEVVKELPADYSYVWNAERVHKANFRRKRFENDENLKYDAALSESEMAKLNGILRIWDCGKRKWSLTV